MQDFSKLPIVFWISLLPFGLVVSQGWRNRRSGWGLPAICVCLTVVAWYHGDVVYNGYLGSYVTDFPASVLAASWLEVCVFGFSLAGFMAFLPNWINRRYAGRTSRVMQLLSGVRSIDSLQESIGRVAYALAMVWVLLFLIALWRTDWDIVGLTAPYLGEKASPWARGQVAASWLDSLSTLFASVEIMCAALLGACAATLRWGLPRFVSIVLVILSWPGYIFDRTRHTMLLVLLPAVLIYTFIRLRGRGLLQITVLLTTFLGFNAWFKFVLVNRTDTTIASAFTTRGKDFVAELEDTKHLGLNMFEELCWVNYLLRSGEYAPKAGRLYLANLVNPLPRAVWPGKPTIGLDYAIARGQGGDIESGTTATLATGMIGSGIANFGMFLGPIAAAFLMSLWCAFLARLDLASDDFEALLVYLLGCISIFNFGRDISLLVAYPTLLGFALLCLYRRLTNKLGSSYFVRRKCHPRYFQRGRLTTKAFRPPNAPSGVLHRQSQ